VDSTDVDSSATAQVAFSLAFSGSASSGDVTIRNNSNFTASSARALLVNTGGAASVRSNIQDSHFTNNSATVTASLLDGGSSISETTVQGNTFTNNGTGDNFETISSGTAAVRMNLGGDVVADFNQANGGNTAYRLNQTGSSTFSITQRTATVNGTRNVGTVTTAGTIGDLGTTTPTQPTVPP
jgi:hypothetical protein